MPQFIDLTGKKFGRLTVIERAENHNKHTYWRCLCDCGNETVVRADCLQNGISQSCGCLQKEISKSLKPRLTHGKRHTVIYAKYTSIKTRCFNKNAENYPRYGGRGITIYPEWIHDFQAFYDYVSQLEHYGEEGYALDRINNDCNYEPGNLRFADNKTQARNKRNTVTVDYKGETMILKDVAELTDIPYKTLYYRYKNGDRGDKLFRPVRKIRS